MLRFKKNHANKKSCGIAFDISIPSFKTLELIIKNLKTFSESPIKILDFESLNSA